jgi:hypothetical protein
MDQVTKDSVKRLTILTFLFTLSATKATMPSDVISTLIGQLKRTLAPSPSVPSVESGQPPVLVHDPIAPATVNTPVVVRSTLFRCM